MFKKKNFNKYLNRFNALMDKIGLHQRRCFHCMRPFFPGDLSAPERLCSTSLCPECSKIFIPFTGTRCKLCGLPMEMDYDAKKKALCPDCNRSKPLWVTASYYGLYSGCLRDLILRLKFDQELYLAKLLAEFILESVRCVPKPDLIIPVPQYPKHLCKRGYNQANEIAKALAIQTKLQLGQNFLHRIRPGMPQERLNAAQRRANLRGAFKANKDLKNCVIWLVDDVMTTGSTCQEAASALLKAEAKEVHVIFVARTPL